VYINKSMSQIFTTIVIKKPTRELLRQVGHKDQTYDQLINELIQNSRNYDKGQSSFTRRVTTGVDYSK
jgi:hypothetical protein